MAAAHVLLLAAACGADRIDGAPDHAPHGSSAGGHPGTWSGSGGESEGTPDAGATGAGQGGAEDDSTRAASTGGATASGTDAASGEAGNGGESGNASEDGGSTNGGRPPGHGGAPVAPPDAFTVDVIRASDVKPSAPGTIGIVTFSVPLPSLVEAHVEFGLDTTYGTSAPADLTAPGHRTLLLGMKPARTYHFRVVASDGALAYHSRDYTLSTGPATTALPFAGLRVVSEAKRERGFVVMSYWFGPGRRIPFIVDADGEVVWWYESPLAGIGRAAMSASGKNMWLVRSGDGGPLVRVTMDTLEEQVYDGVVASHDITAVEGETMAFIEYGEADCDSVFEIEPSGSVREIFESEGIFDAATCHGNAIRYSKTEDVYTYSDRLEDVVALSRSGEVLWRLSERVPGGNAVWGGAQHGHHLLDSSLLVFANEGTSSDVSAGIEYDLEGREIGRFESGRHSGIMGDAQRLPGKNTLLTFSAASVVQEFDPNGQVVMELDGGGECLGYAAWRPTLYGPPAELTL